MIVSVIYRSPSQNNREFDSFLLTFEQLLSDIITRKPTASITTREFNARSYSWWSHDINISEDTNLYSLTSSNRFSQLINKLTHAQTNSFSCIDLIFQDFISDYKKADPEKIRKALDLVNWERLFSNKDINAEVSILNETTLNVFSNSVCNNYITIDDKDPLWMNKTIKLKIKAKDNMYKKYIRNERFEGDFVLLQTLITELNELLSTSKALYYQNLGKKFINPVLQAKPNLSIQKTLNTVKKIPLIPDLLKDDKFVTDMKTKAIYFEQVFGRTMGTFKKRQQTFI